VKPELIVALGGIVTLIGAGISIYGGYRTGQQERDDAKRLADAQADLANAQTEGIRQITGGDSFCYLKVLPQNKVDAELIVLQVGKYPISDVSLRFVDSDQLTGPTPPGQSAMDRILRAQTTIPIGTLSVNGFRFVEKIQVPGSVVEKQYLASFTARNGSWDQSIILRRTPSRDWRVALKVNKNPGQVKFAELNSPWKLLFHEVAPDFPVKSDHEIHDWIGEEPKG
jgi:hypothetical protein